MCLFQRRFIKITPAPQPWFTKDSGISRRELDGNPCSFAWNRCELLVQQGLGRRRLRTSVIADRAIFYSGSYQEDYAIDIIKALTESRLVLVPVEAIAPFHAHNPGAFAAV